jgi:4-hydroxybutyrate CoA-transferase
MSKSFHSTGYKSGWEEEFKRKSVSPENAAKVVKSNDRILFPLLYSGIVAGKIAERADELKNVEVITQAPLVDPGWYSPEMKEFFSTACEIYIYGVARPWHDAKFTTFIPSTVGNAFKVYEDNRPEKKPIDVFVTELSPPDENGFCSFGAHMWHRKKYAKLANIVIGEIGQKITRTYGDNFIHISEIDYFVQVEEPGLTEEEWKAYFEVIPKDRHDSLKSRISTLQFTPRMWRNLIPILSAIPLSTLEVTLGIDQPDKASIGIAENLKSLIKDRDTIQIGVGRPSKYMIELGVFDNCEDLGIHSEMATPRFGFLVKRGIATGKYKTINPGKAVFNAFSGMEAEEIAFASNNPAFEMRSPDYVTNIKTISSHDNMIAINNGLQIDLTGQICSETQFGPRMINGPGGQIEFHIGAFLSKGGRAVTLLRSTAFDGAASTIVPQLDMGSLVTIQRHYADHVITEFGIARLAGKSHRERAEELINIAHPDFRSELRKEAKKLFWP